MSRKVNVLVLGRWLTRLSLLGLIIGFMLWIIWFNDTRVLPRSLLLLFLVTPLALPVHGIFHERVKTYMLTSFLALLYFLIGIWVALAPGQILFGSLMTLLSVSLFLGCYFFLKAQGKKA